MRPRNSVETTGTATRLSEETTVRKVNNATIAVDYTLAPQNHISIDNLISVVRALYGVLKKRQ